MMRFRVLSFELRVLQGVLIDRLRPRNPKFGPRTCPSSGRAEARGRLPAEECLLIGAELTTALAQLHRHELVHRDIKPSNIIFVRGAPKLADIGLVASIDA